LVWRVANKSIRNFASISRDHMKIQTIIFSKDRPLQLHATLASFALHEAEGATNPIAVLFRSSTESFANAYARVVVEFDGKLSIDWVKEVNFKIDLLDILQGSRPSSRLHRFMQRLGVSRPPLRSTHLLFLVDDNLFVRPFSLQRIVAALSAEPRAIGFSLRIGRNTTSCYPMRCNQPLPCFESSTLGLCFTWPSQVGDFGYPLEVSSSVYRTTDLISMLRSLPYNNPSRLEQGLAAARGLFARRLSKLLCFEQSVTFCVPLNKVQTIFNNRSSEQENYSSEALNALFLQGYRVDVEAMQYFTPMAAHEEIELPLKLTKPA
jgi:hypothetical protein